jgi:hypothetical protein
MTIKIDATRAIELLRKVVAEKGEDFVYESPNCDSCVYTDEKGNPSCGVGYALYFAGVPLESIAALDHRYTTEEQDEDGEYFTQNYVTPESAHQLPVELENAEVTPFAAEVFVAFQSLQDGGKTYATSLARAESVYGALGGTE